MGVVDTILGATGGLLGGQWLGDLFGIGGDDEPEAPEAPEVTTTELPADETEAEAEALRTEEEAEANKNKGYAGTTYTTQPSLLNSIMSQTSKNKLG